MRVALAQVAPVLGNLRDNLALHRSMVLKAAAAGADLVVFPELSMTGYLLQERAAAAEPEGRHRVRLRGGGGGSPLLQ